MRRQNNMMMQPRDRLQDLDRELELLRRKRQLIEDQGQYGQGGRQNQQNDGYNQPRASYNQFDYGNMYESSGAGGYEGSGGYGGPRRRGKRPAPAPRWQDDAPKRFRGQQDSWPAQAPKFTPRAQKPAFKPPVKAATARPTPPKKPFADKPAGPKPAKTATKPEAKPSPSPSQAGAKKVVVVQAQVEEYILSEADLAGKLPRKVQGRLEFALGVVYKQVRQRNGEQHATLFEYSGARLIKNAIRLRLRTALLGCAVPDVAGIVEAYSGKYPPEADQEMLDAAAAALAEKTRLDREVLDAAPESAYLAQEVPSDDPEDFFKKNLTKALEAKLQDVFKKVKTLCEDDAPSLEQLVKNADEATKRAADATATNNETTTEEPAKKEQANTAEGETKPSSDGDKVENRMEYFKKLMNGLINAELPKLLPNFEEELRRIIDVDNEYVRARHQLARKADVMARQQQEHGRAAAQRLPLMYVMVMGTPKLPKKAKLQSFLRSFNPVTIKKHRNVHNVLYVGFSDKKDFQLILAANDSLMDSVKLTIKESGKFQNPKTVLKQAETNSANTSIDNAIDSDLDGQINDLLTSIRRSEETDQAGEENSANKDETAGEAASENAENTEATDGQGEDNGDFTENWNEENTGNGAGEATTEFTEDWDEELAREKANGGANGEPSNEAADAAVAKNPQVAQVQQTSATKQPATPTGINTRRSSRINNA